MQLHIFLGHIVHCKAMLNPNWHEGGHFYPLVLLGLDFVS